MATVWAHKEVLDGFDTTLPATGFVSLVLIGRFASGHPLTIVLLLFGVLGLLILALRGGSLRAANLRIFCGVVGRNLKCGMTAREALTAAREAVRGKPFRTEIARIAANIDRGATLSESMKGSWFFPRSLVLAAAAGESRGNLADAFLDMADFYRQESERARAKLAVRAVAVPASFMAVFVVFCVISTVITAATFFKPLFGGVS
jgi:type II secretory pathway component PulF